MNAQQVAETIRNQIGDNKIIHEMTFNYCPPLYDKIADHHFDVGYSTDFTQMYIERPLQYN